jgi:hypothetical protein
MTFICASLENILKTATARVVTSSLVQTVFVEYSILFIFLNYIVLNYID